MRQAEPPRTYVDRQSMEHPPAPDAIRSLASLMRGRGTLVLSGAGLSTESGIPDYRGPTSRARPPQPIKYQEFVASEEARKRYWARSALGWPRMRQALPNRGHYAIARMEMAGVVQGVITQNVDGLHQAAGSAALLELHGGLAKVMCLRCGSTEDRPAMQNRIFSLNPGWADDPSVIAGIQPDGDAVIDPALIGSFRVPVCLRCGGPLKPDVVLFGENVPRKRVEAAMEMVDRAQVLLVVGSSLATYSGLRFVVRASDAGKDVAIINLGPTRGDRYAAVRIEAPLGEALPALAALLTDGAR
jgi:NAD-dependent deacetylase sirtuin 4